MSTRISKDEMFMRMAEIVATRSTCLRRQVGVVITDAEGMSVVSIGYNGNAKGLPNKCDSDVPGDCGCIHAEVNALIKAPFHQGELVMYSSCAPCEDCAKLILNSRIAMVFYRNEYRTKEGLIVLNKVKLNNAMLPHAEIRWPDRNNLSPNNV